MSNPSRKPNIGDATRPPPEKGGLQAADWIALILSMVWFAGVAVFFLVLPEPQADGGLDPARLVMTILAIVMPVALIWVGAMAVRSARLMRQESNRLQAAIDAMRHAYVSQAPQGASGVRLPLEQKLDEIARAQKKTEAALAHLTSVNTRAAAAMAKDPERAALTAPKKTETAQDSAQPALALGTPVEALVEPISSEDFIRALNFPDDERDKEGFRALRLALKDRSSSALIRSAQDILTLLAEDGIYMDDLTPDRARPEIWRRFAEGERGRTIASLGGIRDRSSLALTAGRMRQDPVFRDCAHHFLRKFDTTFSSFGKDASDAEIAAFADTRSARAFMLIGRVSGTFD
ncbi:hypothetical protein [Aliiruegeria lutimaris]|uniref:Uncharacterized protein n=1 Tax=Aliiruegeria lutimaris TaxID=571298 RepID=A0A1G8P4Y1_9RHOB|nr:hypothetical protein [Aliiruegeria lutimaris]SDI87356.1 hypothetical protein SAMN04488026_100866 [Aliiruegeria lutimaris]